MDPRDIGGEKRAGKVGASINGAAMRRGRERIASAVAGGSNKVWESGCGAMFIPKDPYPNERTDLGSFG